jgi:hypothetical protein
MENIFLFKYMRIKLIAIVLLAFFTHAQVGINSNPPISTLHIVGNPDASNSIDGLIGPRLTLEQLKNKTAYSTDQVGALVYITDVSLIEPTIPDKFKKIISPGYYYYKGLVWENLESKTGSVIFLANLGETTFSIPPRSFIPIPIQNTVLNIGGGTWNSSTHKYKIPVSGTYLIKASIRLQDGTSLRDMYISVNDILEDNVDGIWKRSTLNRFIIPYSRIVSLAKDTEISLYTYSDAPDLDTYTSDSNMFILLLSTNIE